MVEVDTDRVEVVMDWEAILRYVPPFVAAVGSVVAAVIKLRRSRTLSKVQLERDLALLDKLPNQDADLRDRVAASVSEQVRYLYPTLAERGPRRVPWRTRFATWLRMFGAWAKDRVQWGPFVAGVVFAVGFGIWTADLVSDGFTPWALLTGFWGLAGVGWVITAMERSLWEAETDDAAASHTEADSAAGGAETERARGAGEPAA